MAVRKKVKHRGPSPDTLIVDDDWRSAMKKALQKKRPSGGFPDPPKRKKK